MREIYSEYDVRSKDDGIVLKTEKERAEFLEKAIKEIREMIERSNRKK